jgi:cardiolipin synthase
VDDEQFERSASHLLGNPIVGGNSIITLKNGCRYFPEMLKAIAAAEKSISFESFIYVGGEIGKLFGDALMERARAGVKVHVLIDWVGSWAMTRENIRTLREAGVQVELYRPFNFWNLPHFNNRTHRKILVIDGLVAFTGGAAIADEWDGDADRTDLWRDNQYLVRGPAVAQIQATFMDNWIQTHYRVLKDERYFPKIEPAGEKRAQVFMSGPSEGLESAMLMVLLSIACARRTIRIGNAYFVPDNLVIASLVAARKRGVKVEIIVPGLIDARVVARASRARFGDLLESGCKIYRFTGALYHCKMMVIDECWSSVGSSNFDTRSFRLNDEMNINVLDADFAREQTEIFEEDKLRSELLDLETWRNRPYLVQLRDKFCALFRSQL